MIRVLAYELSQYPIKARLPFRYGIATMTGVTHVFLRLAAEIDGVAVKGLAAENLAPKWFTKDPARPLDEEAAEMLAVIRQAAKMATGHAAPTAFAFWRDLYDGQESWARAQGLPPLLAHLGTSLVERALLDAFCHRHGRPLHQMVQANRLGIDLGRLHPELTRTTPARWLPASPRRQVVLRHTVGLGDALETSEIRTPLDDGLPEALEDCIATHGLRHFKVKLSGRIEPDLERLRRLAALFRRVAPRDYAVSLDGNEGFRQVDEFRRFWGEVRADTTLQDLLGRTLFIEQPLHRDVALAAGARFEPDDIRPPVIIDESDASIGSLAMALSLGYAGTSHKNCKGVFKGIGNACRLAQLRELHPDRRFVLSGEDLTNIGPVALMQDLAVQALLDIESIERNGHHYFPGLSFWSPAWQKAVLRAHPDLFERSPAGWPRLAIRDGQLDLASVNAAPFGCGFRSVLDGTPAE